MTEGRSMRIAETEKPCIRSEKSKYTVFVGWVEGFEPYQCIMKLT